MIRKIAAPQLSLAGIVWTLCLIAISACRSGSGSGPAVPVQPEMELTMAGADSQLFDAVVRTQLGAQGDDDYPHRLDRFRIDARPYGTNSGYPEVFAGVQGVDPTLSFARASEREIERLTRARKSVLEASAVREGRLIPYAQCAGAGVPVPPAPASRGRSSAKRPPPQDVHAGCPTTPEHYLTVGLPIRGVPDGLKDTRDTRGKRVRPEGEVWSVLVDETAMAAAGWRRSQYAWIFRRNDEGHLELANTILVSVVD